jgi:hypothetical protein
MSLRVFFVYECAIVSPMLFAGCYLCFCFRHQFYRKCAIDTCRMDLRDTDAECPRLLPCGHAFCTTCLFSRMAVADGSMSCPLPTCGRKISSSAATDSLPFPKHWAVLDALAAEAPPVAPRMCSCVAEDNPHLATLYCGKCDQSFCDANMMLHKKHGAVTPLAAGSARSSTTVMCTVHPTSVLHMFCQPCAQPICVQCEQTAVANGGHAGHSLSSIDAVTDACKSELVCLSATSQARSRDLHQASQLVFSQLTDLHARRVAADRVVNQAADAVTCDSNSC